MEKARLIKERDLVHRQDDQTPSSRRHQVRSDVIIRGWVKDREAARGSSPRELFAALFAPPSDFANTEYQKTV